jgi:hypothetical protein
MAFIQMQMANTVKSALGTVFALHSDIECNFSVVMSEAEVNTYYIYESEAEVFKLEYSGVISYRGKKLNKEVNKGHWRYPGFLGEELLLDFNWGILIDEQVVSSVSYGGYFFDWVKEMWKEKKLLSYSPWMRIEFDAGKVNSIVAACVLFSYVAQVTDQ